MSARALVYIAPHQAEIQPVPLPVAESPDAVTVATAFSGVSRGTERLVFEGRLPESEWARMQAPFQTGAFPFPVKYGYAAAGTVIEGPEGLRGRRVFALHPHQDFFRVPAAAVMPLPDDVPCRRAILAANMETALNAVWDAAPQPGERILITGAGLLGCLIVAVLRHMAHRDITLCDTVKERGAIACDFGVSFRDPAETGSGYDLAFHTSATAAGLQGCIDAMGFEGRILELSWYGDAETTLRLGGTFHSQRLRLISSQVGHVATQMRDAVTHRDRLGQAVSMLADPRLDTLITGEVAFDDLPAALPAILAPGAPGIATAIRYPSAEES